MRSNVFPRAVCTPLFVVPGQDRGRVGVEQEYRRLFFGVWGCGHPSDPARGSRPPRYTQATLQSKEAEGVGMVNTHTQRLLGLREKSGYLSRNHSSPVTMSCVMLRAKTQIPHKMQRVHGSLGSPSFPSLWA